MSWNIVTSFNIAPFQLYDEELDIAAQRQNLKIMTNYFFKINELCRHGALFLWKL